MSADLTPTARKLRGMLTHLLRELQHSPGCRYNVPNESGGFDVFDEADVQAVLAALPAGDAP